MDELAQTLVEAQGLGFAYAAQPVLDGIGFALRPHEFVGLVGPNGSGKSTLLRVLLGLLPAGRGEVRLAGDPVRLLSRRQIARRAAFVPQETPMEVALAAREVVAMGRNPYLGRFQPETLEDQEHIRWALELTETADFAARPLNELSGGERQRVMLARAVAQQAAVLLLDEPTANLDPQHQLEIMQLVAGLVKKKGCALAAIHDLSLAGRFCDRVLLLAQGRIVADGPPVEVLTAANLRTYFRIEAKVLEDRDAGGLVILPLAPLRGL